MTKKYTSLKNTENGYVVMINTLVFLSISIVLIYGIINPIISSHKSTRAFMASKEAFLLSNSASEEALYRLKNGLAIDNTETLILNGKIANISVGDSGSDKIVTVNSDVDGFQRNINVKITQGVGVSFNYGLQAGQGGFIMSGGAFIDGNIYSNGDVVGSGGPYITGSANVANLIDPSAVLTNGSGIPAGEISFGANYTEIDAAQSFELSSPTDISSIRLYIKKSSNNWMNNVTLRIVNDDNGKPGTNTLATGSIGATQVTTSFNYLSIPLSNTVTAVSNTPYWIVLDGSKTWGSHYSLGTNSGIYTDGKTMEGTWSSNKNKNDWQNTSPTGQDIFFEIFSGGDTGLISGLTIYGNAWAHEINGSTVYGDIYCQASVNTNKACDTTRPDPAPVPFPVSDGNIEEWKAVALLGGVIIGDQNYGSDDNIYLGPKKIEGDLKVGAGATLYVTGTLWVTGDIDVTGGGTIRLDSSYGDTSGIIVSDGNVDAGGGGEFEGSGTDGSYILVVTTSNCPTGPDCGNDVAVDLSGGAGAVILNAQKGTLRINGGGQAKQVTAHTVEMTGGANVVYETGISDMNFTSQPSGTWNIIEWDEE